MRLCYGYFWGGDLHLIRIRTLIPHDESRIIKDRSSSLTSVGPDPNYYSSLIRLVGAQIFVSTCLLPFLRENERFWAELTPITPAAFVWGDTRSCRGAWWEALCVGAAARDALISDWVFSKLVPVLRLALSSPSAMRQRRDWFDSTMPDRWQVCIQCSLWAKKAKNYYTLTQVLCQ